jgi:hypothetical protein
MRQKNERLFFGAIKRSLYLFCSVTPGLKPHVFDKILMND